MMISSIEKVEYTVLESLHRQFGDLLTLDDLAQVYKYPTIDAVRKAHSRGTLPVKLYRFPNKRGFYARTDEVAISIENMLVS